MLTRMTRMARMLTHMLTRMTRWLAGSHIIHTRIDHFTRTACVGNRLLGYVALLLIPNPFVKLIGYRKGQVTLIQQGYG